MRKTTATIIGVLSLLASLTVGATPAEATHTEYTRTVRYGPFTIPAAQPGQPGMIENDLSFGVRKPCVNCYITSMTPDLTYADGSNANVDTGPMLHHMVLSSQWRRDATCSGNLLGLIGERLFASGNERTVMEMPDGYGYRIGWLDSWNLIADVMNMAPVEKTVYIDVTFTYRSGWADLEPVRPVWLDVDQCGDSEYEVPEGPSDTHWDWNVNVPGEIVAIGGHVHDDGVRIEAVNETTGESICDSIAGYGGSPEYTDMMGRERISSMTTCIGAPVATIDRGDLVRIHSVYDSQHPHDDAMGIMIAYIDEA